MSEAPEKKYDFIVNLISGGCAGVAVDVCLYPLDTLKTRFQAPEGFFKAGGFNADSRDTQAEWMAAITAGYTGPTLVASGTPCSVQMRQRSPL